MVTKVTPGLGWGWEVGGRGGRAHVFISNLLIRLNYF